MPKKKKFLLTLLLISIYALFMYQEIIVSQVVCFKDNGSRDIELAVFSFNCECKDEGFSPSSAAASSQTNGGLTPKMNNCIDLPLDNSWLRRNTLRKPLENNFIYQYTFDVSISLLLTDPYLRLLEAVPLSKFLFKPFFPFTSVVQRC